jgi:amphiphysin
VQAYGIADDYIREYVPPILAKILEFLPLAVEIAVQVQHTLLQHSYSQLYHYANEHGFTDPDSDVVVAEWEELFMPVKAQVESELRLIAKGKAVTLPMNAIYDNSVLKKVPGISSVRNPLAKGKPPPPPPPPEAANGSSPPPPRGRENSQPGLGRPKSTASISSRYSRTEVSPAPPIPQTRPTIGSVRAASASYSAAERDESPPPPLPGPRPTSNGSTTAERPRIGSYGSSYGGGVGSVTPTPLAGLRPTALTGGSARSPSPNTGRIGRSLVPSAPTVDARSPSPAMAALVVGKKKPPPPPPKKKFAGPKEVWVRALFTFEGQDHGDLSFEEGERIKVLKKTESTDGERCFFPGSLDGFADYGQIGGRESVMGGKGSSRRITVSRHN